MSCHGVFRKLKSDPRSPAAPFLAFRKLELVHIRYEVAFPYSAYEPLNQFSFRTEIIRHRLIPILEDERVIKNKVKIVIKIHDQRRGRNRQKAGRLIALPVVHLVPGVKWRREQ